MAKRETAEEFIARLEEEYDFSGEAVGKIHGCRPEILVEYRGQWVARMENSTRLPLFFRNQNGEFIKATAVAETLPAVLKKLEKLCLAQKKSGAILVEPSALPLDGRNAKRVTLDDIAKKVGCSRATVSFAVLGTHPVNKELKMRILAEIERSNYRPSAVRKESSRQMVVLLNRFFEGAAAGPEQIADLLFKRGYIPVSCWLPLYDPLDQNGIAALAQIRKMSGVAGVLSLHPALESMDILRYSGDLPVAISGRPDSMLSSCYFDFKRAGELVASQIRKYRHKQAAFVSFGEFDTREYRLLAEGLKKAEKKDGSITILDISCRVDQQKMEEELLKKLDEVYDAGCSFLFIQSQFLCRSVLKWIQQHKISVPEELSLVTLDYDSNALSGRMKVNTILIPNRMINEAAVEELICKIEHKASGKKVFLPAIKDQGTVGIAPKNRNSKVWKTEKQPKK